MRLLFAAVGICMMIHSVEAQNSVSLRNVSYPHTAIEVGNTVEVKIAGAAPNGTVIVVQNGAPPFTFGTTNGSGNWSVTAVEPPSNVGAFSQTWYVNGTPMTPNNPDMDWLPYSPRLPNFDVYANFTGTNCPGGPGQSTVSESCGGTNTARHWIWRPVFYSEFSSLQSSAVTIPAGNWNTIQSRLSLQNGDSDILLYDATRFDANGQTLDSGSASSELV